MPVFRRHGIERIISGGQSGVDRAALDAALESGTPCGGWCPRNRRAEDGTIDPRYPLIETEGSGYAERTARNVESADGTLILTRGELTGGTALAHRLARELGKPCLVVDLSERPDPETARAWIARHHIRSVNVAGPRESQQAGIYSDARQFLIGLMTREDLPPP
jgi:hypothetical protein